jgi:serine protease Do
MHASKKPVRRGEMTRLCALAAAFLRGARRAMLLAAGLAALSFASAALAQAPERPGPRHAHVELQSLHPIVTEVLPAVVNVAVVMQAAPAAEEGRFVGPGLGQGRPNLAQMPFDEFLRRFFGKREFPPEQAAPQAQGPSGVVHLALGSGFIIDPEGYIVTNNHVVEQARSVTVAFQDNTRHRARIVGRDPRTDLALLKIETDKMLPYLEWGDSDAVEVGDWVMAVGNPFGLGGTVTAGIISARGRDIQSGPYDDFLQIDAPMNRGSSGGPTFDMNGEVIGINTAIFSPSGGSVGIGFAIPSNLAKPVVDQLRARGRVERGWLGVAVQPITPEIARSLAREDQNGALVTAVTPDSPAAKAGVRQGDVILSFNGEQVLVPRDLSIAVAKAPIDKAATLLAWRDGKEITLQPMIVAMPQGLQAEAGAPPAPSPAPPPSGALGLQLAPLTGNLRRELEIPSAVKGAVVTAVASDSPAAGQIRPGDVIEAVNQRPVASPQDAIAQLQSAARSGKKDVLILLNRKGTDLYVGIEIG